MNLEITDYVVLYIKTLNINVMKKSWTLAVVQVLGQNM